MDSGPMYAETCPGRFPVEPWNTTTNLVFLALIVYWAVRTKMDVRRHPLIVASLPLILVGFVGGTIYHATRSSDLWLMMDYGPISLVALMGCVYFWRRITSGWFQTFLLVMAIPVALRAYWGFFPASSNFSISFGYALLAINVATPIILHCLLNGGRGAWLLVGSVAAIGAALLFRVIDLAAAPVLPMGTHFLWHLLGACSVCLAMFYAFFTADFKTSILQRIHDRYGGKAGAADEL